MDRLSRQDIESIAYFKIRRAFVFDSHGRIMGQALYDPPDSNHLRLEHATISPDKRILLSALFWLATGNRSFPSDI